MKRILIFVVALLTTTVTFAREGGDKAAKYEVEMPSFWTNWYVQVGLDMSLQNPYGRDFSDVFPNGKTFGINAARGPR